MTPAKIVAIDHHKSILNSLKITKIKLNPFFETPYPLLRPGGSMDSVGGSKKRNDRFDNLTYPGKKRGCIQSQILICQEFFRKISKSQTTAQNHRWVGFFNPEVHPRWTAPILFQRFFFLMFVFYSQLRLYVLIKCMSTHNIWFVHNISFCLSISIWYVRVRQVIQGKCVE